MRLADLRHGPLVEGNGASSVRVIAYEDLQCSDCATYRRMLDETLLPSYRDSVAFEHREYPLPKHAWARTAAIAACYFDELKPEIGVAFRRYCFAKQHEIQPHEFENRVREFAESHGIDPAGATAALDDATLSRAVDEQYQEGAARGVTRTPTVFVNDRQFIETFAFEDLSKAIDAALAADEKPK